MAAIIAGGHHLGPQRSDYGSHAGVSMPRPEARARPGGRSAPSGPGTPDFCKSATIEEIRQHGHVLTPARYVGAEDGEVDAEPFEEKMARLVAGVREQQAEAAQLDVAIAKNLARLGYRLHQESTT